MELFVKLIISALAVIVTSLILPGVHIDTALTALIVAVVLSLLNTVIKPVLVFLTIPITLVTMGLFLLVINACMILITSKLVSGFVVEGFLTAMLFSIILSIINALLGRINLRSTKDENPD